MDVDINGVIYRKVEIKQPVMAPAIGRIMMMAAMYGGMYGMLGSKPKSRPTVNLVEEYKLIQQKKSELSRNDRDWVIGLFNREYKRV